MTTADEYWQLAARYGKLADEAPPRSYSRHQLQMLADNYMTLARSTLILDRSTKVLQTIAQHQKR